MSASSKRLAKRSTMPRSITTRAARGALSAHRACDLGQRVMFAHVAGEDLRAAHEAAGVEHQPQGKERTIGAFFLGVSASCLGLSARLAFEVGIGQVV